MLQAPFNSILFIFSDVVLMKIIVIFLNNFMTFIHLILSVGFTKGTQQHHLSMVGSGQMRCWKRKKPSDTNGITSEASRGQLEGLPLVKNGTVLNKKSMPQAEITVDWIKIHQFIIIHKQKKTLLVSLLMLLTFKCWIPTKKGEESKHLSCLTCVDCSSG